MAVQALSGMKSWTTGGGTGSLRSYLLCCFSQSRTTDNQSPGTKYKSTESLVGIGQRESRSSLNHGEINVNSSSTNREKAGHGASNSDSLTKSDQVLRDQSENLLIKSAGDEIDARFRSESADGGIAQLLRNSSVDSGAETGSKGTKDNGQKSACLQSISNSETASVSNANFGDTCGQLADLNGTVSYKTGLDAGATVEQGKSLDHLAKDDTSRDCDFRENDAIENSKIVVCDETLNPADRKSPDCAAGKKNGEICRSVQRNVGDAAETSRKGNGDQLLETSLDQGQTEGIYIIDSLYS